MYQSWKLTKVLSCDPPTNKSNNDVYSIEDLNRCVSYFGSTVNGVYVNNNFSQNIYTKAFINSGNNITWTYLYAYATTQITYGANGWTTINRVAMRRER